MSRRTYLDYSRRQAYISHMPGAAVGAIIALFSKRRHFGRSLYLLSAVLRAIGHAMLILLLARCRHRSIGIRRMLTGVGDGQGQALVKRARSSPQADGAFRDDRKSPIVKDFQGCTMSHQPAPLLTTSPPLTYARCYRPAFWGADNAIAPAKLANTLYRRAACLAPTSSHARHEK